MSLEVFSGTSIPRELTTAAMEYLWAKWKTLYATGDLTLQRLTEESNYPLRDRLVFLMTAGDDFVYTYVGAEIQRAIGRDRAGSLLSTSGNPMRGEYARVYRKVADDLIPACLRYTLPTTQNGKIWQRLILPVPIADTAVCLVVYSELIDHHKEVYDQLFRTAPDAMVVACPIANDVGHTKDGWIIMMNDRARDMLGFTRSIGNLRLSEIPQFAGVDVWGRLYGPNVSSGLIPVPSANFDIELMRFPHVFGLKLRPRLPQRISDNVALVPSLA